MVAILFLPFENRSFEIPTVVHYSDPHCVKSTNWINGLAQMCNLNCSAIQILSVFLFQGTHIVSKLRPVDHLRQLLVENQGPDNEVVKSFFTLHSEVQAACACLVLACSQAVQDAHVAEWATRALFLYGGEPRLVFPGQQQQQQQQQRPQVQGIMSPGVTTFSQTSFHPNIASTPAPHMAYNTPSNFFEKQFTSVGLKC